MKYYVTWAGKDHEVEIHPEGEHLRITVDGVSREADVAVVDEAGLLNLLMEGNSVTYAARFENGHAVLSFHDREVRVAIEDERARLARLATGGGGAAEGEAHVQSNMPGVVKEVRVAKGDLVPQGHTLLILEAMKMENEIKAPLAGAVTAVHVAAGEAVEKGAALVDLGPPANDGEAGT